MWGQEALLMVAGAASALGKEEGKRCVRGSLSDYARQHRQLLLLGCGHLI